MKKKEIKNKKEVNTRKYKTKTEIIKNFTLEIFEIVRRLPQAIDGVKNWHSKGMPQEQPLLASAHAGVPRKYFYDKPLP